MALPQVPAFRLKPPLSGVSSGKFLSQSSRADRGWFCCSTVGLFFFKHICWASGRAAVTLGPQASARLFVKNLPCSRTLLVAQNIVKLAEPDAVRPGEGPRSGATVRQRAKPRLSWGGTVAKALL